MIWREAAASIGAPRQRRISGTRGDSRIFASQPKQLFCWRMHSENSSSCGVSKETMTRYDPTWGGGGGGVGGGGGGGGGLRGVWGVEVGTVGRSG